MNIYARLQSAGLRATPKRLAIAGLLFDGVDRHVTADDVRALAEAHKVRVSLATVYNTLNQFVAAGVMKRITLDSDRTYFDTNVSEHHHLFFEGNGKLVDVPGAEVHIEGLTGSLNSAKIRAIDVIVRMEGEG